MSASELANLESHGLFASCRLAEEKSVETRVRRRYAKQFAELESAGFRYEYAIAAKHSALLLPFVLLAGLIGREVMGRSEVQLVWYNPVLRSPCGQAFANICGISTRFYTFLPDGTVQRTSTQRRRKYFRSKANLRSVGTGKPISETWQQHLTCCESLRLKEVSQQVSRPWQKLLDVQLSEDNPFLNCAVSLYGWAFVCTIVHCALS